MPQATGKPEGVLIKPWQMTVGLVVFMAVLGWGVRTEIRLATMEGNRYTSEDHIEHLGYHVLQRASIEARIPPPQVIDALTEIRRRLERLEENPD